MAKNMHKNMVQLDFLSEKIDSKAKILLEIKEN